MIETLGFPLEIKNLSDTGEIVGLASVYGNLDRQGEAVAAGAFRSSIERMRAKSQGLPMMREHRADLTCGVWTGFEETGGALRVTGRLLLDTQAGREAHSLARAGALGGLSVGFSNAKRTVAGGKRMITEGDLLEVSLVAIPANAEAVIEMVKSTPGPREIEAALKAAGLSNRQAKAAAVGAVKALAAKDPSNEIAALAATISEARQRIAPFVKR
jgi:HK97 family phage prohead protease